MGNTAELGVFGAYNETNDKVSIPDVMGNTAEWRPLATLF